MSESSFSMGFKNKSCTALKVIVTAVHSYSVLFSLHSLGWKPLFLLFAQLLTNFFNYVKVKLNFVSFLLNFLRVAASSCRRLPCQCHCGVPSRSCRVLYVVVRPYTHGVGY